MKQSSSSSSLATKIKPIFVLEHYLGIESGFIYDHESNTMAIICLKQTILFSFETREILLQWQTKLREHFCKERHFLVQVVNVPNNNGHSTNTTNNNQNQNKQIKLGSARLLLQDSKFCLVNNIPPTLLCYWSIKQLRRFGLIDNKFCFEGGSQCGKGRGLHILYTSEPEELIRCFDLASNDQLNSFELSMSKSDNLNNINIVDNLIHKQRSISSSDSSTGDSSSQLLSSFFGDIDTLSANYYCGNGGGGVNSGGVRIRLAVFQI
ncbi:Protein Dok-7 [Dermatophagoides pteronyssinus]|uniref:Protein Dok-7 n=1 Tax=Dermatophagoides pteronyssinus TaxID=6956 RepID=A0ABQ8IX01_DERPT|nr:Protein Dok-7 [Dermatophagoides pteronyssinus]